MSDQTVTQVVTPAAKDPVQSTPPAAAPAPVEPFDAERAKALIDKLRDEVKTLKPFEKQAAELEKLRKEQADKDLTELQKAQKQIAELEAKTKAAERREMQRTVAKEFNLPDAIAELLPGEDLETMKAKAGELKKAIPVTPTLSATNPGASSATVTNEQRRAFMYGNGPLPGSS